MTSTRRNEPSLEECVALLLSRYDQLRGERSIAPEFELLRLALNSRQNPDDPAVQPSSFMTPDLWSSLWALQQLAISADRIEAKKKRLEADSDEGKGSEFDIADRAIKAAYPDIDNRGNGWWGAQPIPNFGILRGAIANEVALLRSQTITPAAEVAVIDVEKDVGEWRVGEFWSSSTPGTKVLMLARGAAEIAQYGAHIDFLGWVGSSKSRA